MLSVDNVVPFLLERGLIDRNWIIDGSLSIRSIARRNRNLEVEGPGNHGFFIKQPDEPLDGGGNTLRCEAAFHRFCRENTAVADLARIVPRLVCDDDDEGVLVFELIPNAINLRSGSESDHRLALGPLAARPLGMALGKLHRVARQADPQHEPRLGWLSQAKPRILNVHEPRAAMLANLSAANFELLHVLQAQNGPGEYLARLSKLWRAETIIHGDIRFDNVLVPRARGGQESDCTQIWIVDWEMVQFGDPAWDLAGALHEYLVVWVDSMPLSDDLAAEQIISQAHVSLFTLRSVIRTFWSGYRSAAGLSAAAADALLLRAVAFSAARLIQSAFELSYEADRLAGRSVILLQLSANLLAEPELGQIQLYGIPLAGPLQ